jgi:hypothetical protein
LLLMFTLPLGTMVGWKNLINNWMRQNKI